MATPDVYRIADRLAPRLRGAFLAAIRRLVAVVSEVEILRAIGLGDYAGLLAAVQLARMPAELEPAVAVVREVVQASAEETLTGLSITASFDLVNPRAISAAATQGATLVSGVTLETQAAIRGLVARAFRDGIAPRDLARLIREEIGLTRRQTQAVLNFRADLAAGGLAGQTLDRRVAAYSGRLLRFRAEMIARTETIAAAANGQLAAWQAAAEAGLLVPDDTRRIWQATPDERTCPVCQELDGQIVAFGEPFVTIHGETLMGPPAHPLCRCTVSLVFAQRGA